MASGNLIEENSDARPQKRGHLLLIGSSSIDVPEVSALISDPGYGVVRSNQDPRSGADLICSFRSLPAALEEGSCDIVYSDNDITRYFAREGSIYVDCAFKLLRDGGVFICSCYNANLIAPHMEDGNFQESIPYGQGRTISVNELLYGIAGRETEEIDIYSLRNSAYNSRSLGELALSAGFADVSVECINGAELVLVAIKGTKGSYLPDSFSRWLDDTFKDD